MEKTDIRHTSCSRYHEWLGTLLDSLLYLGAQVVHIHATPGVSLDQIHVIRAETLQGCQLLDGVVSILGRVHDQSRQPVKTLALQRK